MKRFWNLVLNYLSLATLPLWGGFFFLGVFIMSGIQKDKSTMRVLRGDENLWNQII